MRRWRGLRTSIVALVDLDALALLRDVVEGVAIILEVLVLVEVDRTHFMPVAVSSGELLFGEEAIARKFRAALTAANPTASVPAFAVH